MLQLFLSFPSRACRLTVFYLPGALRSVVFSDGDFYFFVFLPWKPRGTASQFLFSGEFFGSSFFHLDRWASSSFPFSPPPLLGKIFQRLSLGQRAIGFIGSAFIKLFDFLYFWPPLFFVIKKTFLRLPFYRGSACSSYSMNIKFLRGISGVIKKLIPHRQLLQISSPRGNQNIRSRIKICNVKPLWKIV